VPPLYDGFGDVTWVGTEIRVEVRCRRDSSIEFHRIYAEYKSVVSHPAFDA